MNNGETLRTDQVLNALTQHLRDLLGTTIYYTTDGSIPTPESTSGSPPLTLSLESFIVGGTYIIRAIAVNEGRPDSGMSSISFTVSAPPLAQAGLPTFRRSGDPPGTDLMNNTNLLDTDSVIISTASTGASIYYSTDRKRPDQIEQQIHRPGKT